MPFKNTSLFLKETVQSIRNQTYVNWELLAVNDHSDDASFEILEQFARQDSRIRVFHNEGQGIIPALQTGYRKSSGHFITRMDSDDLMVPHKLEAMLAQLTDVGKGHVAHGLVKYFAEHELGDGFQKYEEWLNALTRTGSNFNDIYKECVIASPCWMVHRDDFERCGGFDSEIYPEDYDLVFRFYEHQLTCLPSHEILHHWRDYPTRTSRTHENYAYNVFLEIKVHYFLKLNHDPSRPLVLWGAGKKGKIAASLLLEAKIPFAWICDNPKKIGKTIYDQEMLPFQVIDRYPDAQSIITVANPKAQEEVQGFFKKRGQKPMLDYFFFC